MLMPGIWVSRVPAGGMVLGARSESAGKRLEAIREGWFDSCRVGRAQRGPPYRRPSRIATYRMVCSGTLGLRGSLVS
jgi:hypothetical protein